MNKLCLSGLTAVYKLDRFIILQKFDLNVELYIYISMQLECPVLLEFYSLAISLFLTFCCNYLN